MKDAALRLRVGEAVRRDVGKKRARVGSRIMDALGAASGDILEITGARSTHAILWPADGVADDELIRIDGQTRKNSGASVGDMVRARRVPCGMARSILLVPVRDTVASDDEFSDFVRGRLSGMPVSEGDEISVQILGKSMDFRVGRSAPAGVVRIEDSTSLAISDEPAGDSGPRVTYEEIGGLGPEVGAMRDIVELPLRHPELFARLGIGAHGGILMHGPPGCGKTLIARVLASESDASIYLINGPEIMTKYYGETEARLRDIFKEAKENAPSLVFIDELDAIAPRREEAYEDVQKRVVAQLLALMDGLDDRGQVIVLGATNRPEVLDPALRRPGRFDREVEISVPNEEGRLAILQIHTRGMPVSEDVDLAEMASGLHGYTGADIKSLCREAALKSIRRYIPKIDIETDEIPSRVLESLEIKAADFYDAMHEVVPTAMRELYVERPRISWNDVGGMDGVKEALRDNMIRAMRDPASFRAMGVRPPRGALLYGPSGCGKTLLARALASESGANMILVRGPEILSKWVGESERAIRDIFRKANAASPCVVIFDELDSLARNRSGGEDQDYAGSVLGQILAGIEEIASPRVAVLGITNRPDMLDPSLLRTGRLDIVLYVGPPDENGRLDTIRILTSGMPLADDVSLQEIAVATKNYTGADLSSLCREAAVIAMRDGQKTVRSACFAGALRNVRPSITEDMDRWYTSVGKGISNIVPGNRSKSPYG